jgi:hypothetical protein
MTRFLRFALIAVVICTMGTPAFAIHCRECSDFDGTCVLSPDSGTKCKFTIDGCVTVGSTCTGVADQDTLADTFAVASVEVVTPAGVKTTSDTPRLAARRPAAKAPASTFTR